MKKHVKLDKIDIGMLMVFTAVFGYLLFAFPPIRVNDTFQHENQFVTREPIYALVIQFLQIFWGENYGKPLVLIQNILAIAANFSFARFIKNKFKTGWFLSGAMVITLLAPHILTPLCSVTHLIITNAIMTEGISMSIFLLFVQVLLETMWEEKNRKRNSIIALLLAYFICLIRGQMMTMILVWAVVMGILVLMHCVEQKSLWKKEFWKHVVGIVVLIAVAFTARTYTCRIYNYLEKGVYADTAQGKAMMVANVLYVAEREDGEGIEDEGVRNLFYDIYDALKENHLTSEYAGQGLLARAEHHEDNHEAVNFDYFTDKTKDYVRDTTGIYVEQYMQLMVEVDKVAAIMMKGLLPRCLDRYIYNYIAIVTYGFIRSVAIVNPILNWYALFFYITAIVLTIILWKKDKHSKAASMAALSLLMICANVFATSLIIQCISRYMFYTFPIIYIAALMTLLELYRNHKKTK